MLFRKKVLFCFLLSSVALPCAYAQQPPFTANGTTGVINGDINVNSGINSGVGALAINGGVITTSGSHIITVTGGDRAGLQAVSAGDITFSGTINLSNNPTGYNVSIGVYATGAGSIITLNDALITLATNSNEDDNAIQVEDGAMVKATNTTIDVSSNRSEAIWVHDGGNLDYQGSIITRGNGSTAVAVDNAFSGSSGVRPTVKVAGTIETFGSGTWGANSLYHIGSHGVQVRKGDVTIEADITTHGEGSFGVYALSGGEAMIKNGATIETLGAASPAVYAWNGGTVNIQDATIKSDPDKCAILQNASSQLCSYTLLAQSEELFYPNGVQVSPSAKGQNDPSTINGDGVINIDGGILAGRYGTIDLKLRGDSDFTGFSKLEAAANGPKGVISLDMYDDARWTMTRDSELTNLITRDDSKIIYATTGGTGYGVLTTDRLDGTGGTFVMRSDISQEQGDLLHVLQKSQGNHNVSFNDGSSGAGTPDKEVLVVKFSGDDQDNNTAVFISPGADFGAYHYNLVKDAADGNWYLRAGKSGPGPSEPQLNNTGNASASIMNIDYILSYVEMQTLLQRMGQLRNAAGKEHNLWVRSFGGKANQFSGSRLAGFNVGYYGVQGGIDHQFEGKNGDLFLGFMAGYTEASTDFAGGDGKSKGYHVGFYGTYMSNSGWYVDGVAKYQWRKNSFDTQTVNHYAVNGDGDTKGYQFSVEVGQRFYKDQKSGHSGENQGFYIEPQGQIVYAHQSGADIHSSSGLKTRLGAYDSLLGRASIIFGYSLKDGNNPIDLYFKTGYVHEFKGNTAYIFNDIDRENYRFRGGWWDNGIGVNVLANGRHNLYLEGDYAVGERFDNKFLNVGYRTQF